MNDDFRYGGSTAHVALWDAINAVVRASGGRDCISPTRMDAVVQVENAVRQLLNEHAAGMHSAARRSVFGDRDAVQEPDGCLTLTLRFPPASNIIAWLREREAIKGSSADLSEAAVLCIAEIRRQELERTRREKPE